MPTSESPSRYVADPPILILQSSFTRFRILVIGRPNAGMARIMRELCNTEGGPMIFSAYGEKTQSLALDSSELEERGGLVIENQIVFESNPGFIFHTSVVSGGRDLKLVQDFIKKCLGATDVKGQLHAIWYCIPTNDDQPITAAEKRFFNECETGLVPVIVLLTKTDSLDIEQRIHQQLEEFKYPPKAYVRKSAADCKDLIEKTTAALSSEELQQLLLSRQQNNVELCIAYSIRRIINGAESTWLKYFKKDKRDGADFMANVLGFFPQISVKRYELRLGEPQVLIMGIGGEDVLHVMEQREVGVMDKEYHDRDSISKMMPLILSGLSTNIKLKEIIYWAIVAAILGHLSYSLHERSPSTRNSLKRAVRIYQRSSRDTSVEEAVEEAFERLSTHSHLSHAFKNLFKASNVNCALLAEEAVQIALDNLISLPVSPSPPNPC